MSNFQTGGQVAVFRDPLKQTNPAWLSLPVEYKTLTGAILQVTRAPIYVTEPQEFNLIGSLYHVRKTAGSKIVI